MSHDVFISYSSRDKAVADAVCARLEKGGIRCWYAPRDIVPGAEWASSIVDAIGASRAMVLIFSDFSNASKQVLREISTCVSAEKPLVPFKITRSDPGAGMRYYLATVHWLDAVDGPLEDRIEELYLRLRQLPEMKRTGTGAIPPADPGRPQGQMGTGSAGRGARRKWIWPCAALAVVAACGLLWAAGVFQGGKKAPPTAGEVTAAAAPEMTAAAAPADADGSDPEEMYRLGLKYSSGDGVKQDYAASNRYVLMAAEKGHAEAQFTMGLRYNYGYIFIDQDYEKAAEYFSLAAEQGHARALASLGLLYEEGNGVEQSYEKAAEYYQKAADLGYTNARVALRRVQALLE